MNSMNFNELKEKAKLSFLDKCLNDGWIIYKINDKYHLIKNKDDKSKQINVNDYINNILKNI